MGWFTDVPETLEVEQDTPHKEVWQYKWGYMPSWTWTFVAFSFVCVGLAKYPQLGACNTATDPTNYLTSTNGTCVPGNYDNLDVVGLAFLTLGALIATVNMWIDLINVVGFATEWFPYVEHFKLGPLAEWFKFTFVCSFIFFNASAFSALTTKTTATMGVSVINANVTYQPYNYRLNTSDPSQIASMFFLILGGLIWLGTAYSFYYHYTSDTGDFIVTDPYARTISALSTFFLMISVACNIGPMWYYNVGSTFPTSFYGRQLITASAGLFVIPLFYSLLIVAYWSYHAGPKSVSYEWITQIV